MELNKIDPNESNDEHRNNLVNNNDAEGQPDSNLNNHGNYEANRKRWLPFHLKIKKIKNKYYKRSIYSIIFLIMFVVMIFLNFYGFEFMFKFLSDAGKTNIENIFEIRPRSLGENIIQISSKNWEQNFADLNDYFKAKSPENCKLNDSFDCFMFNETKNSQCSDGMSYGMKNGNPCILVDLKPVSELFTLNMTLNSRIHLKCDGEKNIDKEVIGSIGYIPRNGVPIEYFSSNTTSPYIFVHLIRPTAGVVFVVECHAFSESIHEMIVFDSKTIKFQIMIDI